MLKRKRSKTATSFETDLTLLSPLLHYRNVILRSHQDDYILKILGCGTNQRYSTDVDLLKRFIQRRISLSDCIDKGIEIHHHYINRDDAMILQILHMSGTVTASKDAAKNRCM